MRNRVKQDGSEKEPPKIPKNSLNVKLSPDRRVVGFRTFDLSELKLLARELDCSVNELGMLLCSAAMEHYFTSIGEKIDGDLHVIMPINTRKESDQGAAGNVLSAGFINLHTSVPQLSERLRAIQASSREALDKARPKVQAGIDVSQALDIVSPAIIDLVVALFARLLQWPKLLGRFVFANAVITNVAGPRGSMFIGGARCVSSIPMIPIIDSFVLSWGIASFADQITIGFHGCGKAIRSKKLLLAVLDNAYASLKAQSGAKPERKRARSKSKPAPARSRVVRAGTLRRGT